MTFSLYAATIPSYQQILGAMSGLLVTAETFCAEKHLAPEEIIAARLAQDMLPFAYQVKSTAVHSLGSIEGVRRGVFSPDMTEPPQTFAALKARIAATLEALAAVTPAEVDGFIGLRSLVEPGFILSDSAGEVDFAARQDRLPQPCLVKVDDLVGIKE